MGQNKSVFVTEIDSSIICPECKHVYNTPMVGSCGHTLCKGCWTVVTYEEYVLCPLCEVPLHAPTFSTEVDVTLTETVHNLATYCIYTHCKEIVTLKQRQQHIANEHQRDHISCRRKRVKQNPRECLKKRHALKFTKRHKLVTQFLERLCVALCISAVTHTVYSNNNSNSNGRSI